MVFELLKLNAHITDEAFNAIYPEKIKNISRKHWTPVAVAKEASEFLVYKPKARVLDIGSGVGKFCLIGACNTEGHFTGVEQRQDLVELSQKIIDRYHVDNVEFVFGNMTSIVFNNYDSFYFYNSFYENIDTSNSIDDLVELDMQLYQTYCKYMVGQFRSLPVGSRLVTFCSPLNIIPRSFKLIESSHGGLLKFWEKISMEENADSIKRIEIIINKLKVGN